MRLGERPFGTVRVGVSTSLLKQELAQAALYSLAVALAALGIAVAVGLVVGHLLLQSLRKIANGMDRLARGEYGATVELTRDDELGELAARVNQLGERVHAEQSHWQNDRARMEGILDSLEDAVIVLNAKREVVFCNQAAEGLLGQSLDSPEGALAGLLPADHPLGPVVTELFDAGIERRNSAVKVRCPDGQSRELAVSSYRIPDGERAGGGVLALRNLEPVRAVQSLVTYSQKLAALGRLTSGVAHEVKNPLNAMRIHLELLKARLGASQPPIRENLDVIAQEIVRLDRVVQGFLKFVRPEEIRLAPVQVDALLSEIARLMVPEAARAGARITEDVAPELPPVAGDRELLQQALTNLVTNAIQAMPKGGTVTLGRASGTRRLRRDPHRRRGRRHSRAGSREDLPPVLHDQVARVRHRALDGVSDRADARRPDRRRIRSGSRHGDDPDASGGVGKRADVTKRILLPASALLFLSGCAGNEAVVKKPAAPAAPRRPPPAPRRRAPRPRRPDPARPRRRARSGRKCRRLRSSGSSTAPSRTLSMSRELWGSSKGAP